MPNEFSHPYQLGTNIDACYNPFMPNVFSNPYQMDESISNFRVLGGIFHFYSNFKRNFCLQTVEILIRRHVLYCLSMSHKKNARLYGSIGVNIL